MYNVVLISAQQSDPGIHTLAFFFILFSMMAYHGVFHIVPCAILWALVYPSYI